MQTKAQLEHSRYFLLFIAGLVALTPLSIDVYLPVLPVMGVHFDVNISRVNLTISAYFIGLAFGQFLGGPLSDQVGRKPVNLIGLTLFFIPTVLIMVATSIEIVQVLRALQGIGGGLASVICMAQVRDVFPPEDIIKKYANIILVMLIAPMVAPVLGAIIAPLGWQYIFIFLAIYGLLMLALSWRTIPETNEHPTKQLSLSSIVSGYGNAISLLTNGKYIAIRYALFSVFTAGAFMSYLTNVAFIFMDVFKFNKFEFALLFSVNSIMLMIGNRTASKMMKRVSPSTVLRCGCIFQLISLFILVSFYGYGIHSFWLVMCCLMVMIAAAGAMAPTVSGLFISLYSNNAGSAASLNSTMMFMFGGLIGALAAKLSDGGLLPVFYVMLVSTSIASAIIFSIRSNWHQK